MTILPVYAALLALLFVLLSIRTIRTRHSRKVALGHGDDPAMLRAMRVHANFAEYVPLALLLIYFVEATSHCQRIGVNVGNATFDHKFVNSSTTSQLISTEATSDCVIA